MKAKEKHPLIDPPLWVFRFLRQFCPPQLVEEIQGDLMQRFAHDQASYGLSKAKRRLVWNMIRFFRPGILLRNRLAYAPLVPGLVSNYFKTTARHITRSKVSFSFKLGGLVLSILSFLIAALYVEYQYSFDRYHLDHERIYRVNSARMEDGSKQFYGVSHLSLGPMLKERFPEIESFTRIQIGDGGFIRYDSKVTFCALFSADSTLFDVFTFKFIRGDKASLGKPHAVAISQKLATRIFGQEDPLHKEVTIGTGNKPYQVTAVFEDMPPNSHFELDSFIPITEQFDFSLDEIVSPVRFIDHSSMLYVKLHPGATSENFNQNVQAFLDEHVGKQPRMDAGYDVELQRLEDIYLGDSVRYEFARKGSMVYVYVFILAGLFLLAVGSINYINLCIAGFRTRLKEIGVRKVLGARKGQILGQVIGETLFYCLTASLISVLLLYCLFPQVQGLLDNHLRWEVMSEPWFLQAAAATLLLLTVCSASWPAYQLLAGKVSNDLKGITKDTSRSRFGGGLLITQFAISILAMTAVLVIGKQIRFIHNKDIGMDRDNLLVIQMQEYHSPQKITSFKNAVKSIAGVTSASNTSYVLGGGWQDWYSVETENGMKDVELREFFSDDEMLETLGMKLVAGRFLDATIPADSGRAFVINETAARELGWSDPIGKRILTHPEDKGKWDGTVVGVVKDVNISTLHKKITPFVIRLPWQSGTAEYFVYVRYQGDAQPVIDAIKREFDKIMPGYPPEIDFFDVQFNRQYREEDRAYASLQLGVCMIILISSLGMFSLSMYLSLRRMKEFGIRKILGASVRQVATLHIAYFLRLLLIANVLAMPLAWWLMQQWLEGFAYHTRTGPGLFALVAAVSLTLVLVSAGYSALKSGRMNPVDVIKNQ